MQALKTRIAPRAIKVHANAGAPRPLAKQPLAKGA